MTCFPYPTLIVLFTPYLLDICLCVLSGVSLYHFSDVDNSPREVEEFQYSRSNLVLFTLRCCESHVRMRMLVTKQMQYFFDFFLTDGFAIKQHTGSVNTKQSEGTLASDILTCDNDTAMWISWKDGQLGIGQGNRYENETLIVETQDATGMAIHIKHITIVNPKSIHFTIGLINSK